MYAKSVEKKKRPILMHIGRRLRALRGDMTTSDLAHLVGVTDGAIRMWESGARDPGAEGVILLAQALNVAPHALLSDRDDRSKNPAPAPPSIEKLLDAMQELAKENNTLRAEIESLKATISDDHRDIIAALGKAEPGRLLAVRAALGLLESQTETKKGSG